jgi:hypothetical protein
MVEIVVAALEDVGQQKSNPTIPVDEIDGELKRGACDVSTNIDSIRWGPSTLRYNGALSCADVVVQRQHQVLGWNPWRWWREIRRILRDVPYALRVWHVIMPQEVLCPEKKREEIMSIFGGKHIRDEAKDKNVAGLDGELCTIER